MTDAKAILEGLTEAQKSLLCARLWSGEDPSNAWDGPAFACDITYSRSVQKAITANGLAERITDGNRTAWFCLSPLGLQVRALIEESKG